MTQTSNFLFHLMCEFDLYLCDFLFAVNPLIPPSKEIKWEKKKYILQYNIKAPWLFFKAARYIIFPLPCWPCLQSIQRPWLCIIGLWTRWCSFSWPLHEQTHTMLRVRVRSRGMWAKCRAEVMGSSRKVRSRVHGGVKETRPRLLFAFFSFLSTTALPSFLPEDVSGVPPSSPRPHPAATPQQPRHRSPLTPCLFFCVYEMFLRQESDQYEHVTGCWWVQHFASLFCSQRNLLCLESLLSIYILTCFKAVTVYPALSNIFSQHFFKRFCGQAFYRFYSKAKFFKSII